MFNDIFEKYNTNDLYGNNQSIFYLDSDNQDFYFQDINNGFHFGDKAF